MMIRVLTIGLLLALAAAPAAATVNCNAGVEFHPGGGDVKRCRLNGDHRLHLPKGSVVVCRDGAWIELYPTGALKTCDSKRTYEVDGARCRPGPVVFAPDGRLENCVWE